MTKSEFIKEIASRTNTTQNAAEEFVFAAIDTIQNELSEGGSVDFTGFGKFYVRTRAEREGTNPATGEAMEFAASNTPVFKAGKAFKEKVNK